MKKIVVIGTGRMGGAFATALQKEGRTRFRSADRMPDRDLAEPSSGLSQ